MSGSEITLSDVAKVAGVSLSTASKALSGNDRVSDATRARIREIARRMDFHPNALAQSFARGRSQTIGVLTQNAAGTWSEPILVGAITALGAQEHATLLYDAAFDVGTLEAAIRRLQARRIDGLLVIGDGPHLKMRSLSHSFFVPVVYCFTQTEVESDVTFVPDNQQAGRLAAEHLLESGRRRLVHISNLADAAGQERRAGFLQVLKSAGVEPVLVLASDDWRESDGAELTAQLLADQISFDGLFCGNDHMARGAERVLSEAGLRVPDDVGLVGVDNWEGVVIRHGDPRPHLTTIDLQLSQLGAAAAKRLLSGEQIVGPQLVECRLVAGDTTAVATP